ncbi:universal stress protein [Nocardia thraciensis]
MAFDDDRHHPASAPVVVGVDDSAGAATALRWAARYASRRRSPLRIVHGMNLAMVGARLGAYAVTAAPAADAARAHGSAVVERAERLAREIDADLRVTVELSDDRASALLVGRSAEAHTVVLGATGRTGTPAHLGSTLLAVTSHAQGTVIVVRGGPGGAIPSTGPVVVGVDGSEISEPAIAAAFTAAAERETDLVAVHCWGDWNFGRYARIDDLPLPGPDLEESEDALLAERLAGWQEKYPDIRVTRKVYLSHPAAQLQQWSEAAQLVVVGSRGRGGFVGLLLGSTSNYLVQHAHCPVMVVHPAKR